MSSSLPISPRSPHSEIEFDVEASRPDEPTKISVYKFLSETYLSFPSPLDQSASTAQKVKRFFKNSGFVILRALAVLFSLTLVLWLNKELNSEGSSFTAVHASGIVSLSDDPDRAKFNDLFRLKIGKDGIQEKPANLDTLFSELRSFSDEENDALVREVLKNFDSNVIITADEFLDAFKEKSKEKSENDPSSLPIHLEASVKAVLFLYRNGNIDENDLIKLIGTSESPYGELHSVFLDNFKRKTDQKMSILLDKISELGLVDLKSLLDGLNFDINIAVRHGCFSIETGEEVWEQIASLLRSNRGFQDNLISKIFQNCITSESFYSCVYIVTEFFRQNNVIDNVESFESNITSRHEEHFKPAENMAKKWRQKTAASKERKLKAAEEEQRDLEVALKLKEEERIRAEAEQQQKLEAELKAQEDQFELEKAAFFARETPSANAIKIDQLRDSVSFWEQRLRDVTARGDSSMISSVRKELEERLAKLKELEPENSRADIEVPPLIVDLNDPFDVVMPPSPHPVVRGMPDPKDAVEAGSFCSSLLLVAMMQGRVKGPRDVNQLIQNGINLYRNEKNVALPKPNLGKELDPLALFTVNRDYSSSKPSKIFLSDDVNEFRRSVEPELAETAFRAQSMLPDRRVGAMLTFSNEAQTKTIPLVLDPNSNLIEIADVEAAEIRQFDRGSNAFYEYLHKIMETVGPSHQGLSYTIHVCDVKDPARDVFQSPVEPNDIFDDLID